MKWITLILLIGIARGIVLPDYRWPPNIWLIPFITPIALSSLAVYLFMTDRLGKLAAIVSSLVSLYLSTAIGVLVYGMSAGWQYVTDDTESQAVFCATIGVQTITYIVTTSLIYFAVTRYNKARRT
jgi:large-conductance mechanosensitive channel